ncbi:MAG: SPOR domain-containing protein [Pseudoxanthomonas suwonensis]|nr:SPOR domain-containing protein [Pseudoxanthomonas suwonensis]
MLIRALIVLLAVLNLGIALWWWWRPMPVDEALPAQIDGVPLLQLPGESVDAVPVPPPASARTTPSPGPAVSARPVDAPSPSVVDSRGSGLCHAFGPVDAEAGQPGAQAFAHGRIHVQPAPAASVPPRGWRVVMPPQADLEAALALQQTLRGAGFSDQVLVRNPPETNSIALGLFGSREAALRHRQRLAAAGFRAQVHPTGSDIRPALAFELREGVDPEQVRIGLRMLRTQPVDCDTLGR